ncbi:GNAT family N-acetyltransferase [Alkalibacterium pelagium]|uniref:Ribosomal-protein-serine acetyltransferase n=1 Tax=Alkalibacterium pelagium TaxID=426702 RepID=A0A1H7LZT9_9LACT|nr:GNAT family protein [Alkalibacterium pelagium]GEN51010.1 50S ribosomal protein L7 serine acetyltransferase [Alkalibacterium pelagium]SEL04258.1 ribosomal-protein-serine acetyltransferase [Alkalibacterium pelagium]
MFYYKIDDELSLKLKDYQDTEDLYALIEASREHLKVWMNWIHNVNSEEDIREGTKRNLQQFADQKAMNYLIIYKGEIAGTVGLKGFNWDVKSAEIGYWLGPDFQGKGIMTRAVNALMEYGFDYVGLDKLEVWAAEGNTRSRSIPERLGFVQEGMRRQNEILDDTYHNMIIYGMLKSEWEAEPE